MRTRLTLDAPIAPALHVVQTFPNVRFSGDERRANAVYRGTEPLSANDIAEVVSWISRQPAHVTINVVSMMPNCQSFSGLAVKRAA